MGCQEYSGWNGFYFNLILILSCAGFCVLERKIFPLWLVHHLQRICLPLLLSYMLSFPWKHAFSHNFTIVELSSTSILWNFIIRLIWKKPKTLSLVAELIPFLSPDSSAVENMFASIGKSREKNVSLITVIMTIYVLAIVFLFVTLLLTLSDYSYSLHINQIYIVMCILNLLYCLRSQVMLLCDCCNRKRAWFFPSVLEEPC